MMCLLYVSLMGSLYRTTSGIKLKPCTGKLDEIHVVAVGILMQIGDRSGMRQSFVERFDGFGRADIVLAAGGEKNRILHTVGVTDGVGKSKRMPCLILVARSIDHIQISRLRHAVGTAEGSHGIIGEEGLIGADTGSTSSGENRAHEQRGAAALAGFSVIVYSISVPLAYFGKSVNDHAHPSAFVTVLRSLNCPSAYRLIVMLSVLIPS